MYAQTKDLSDVPFEPTTIVNGKFAQSTHWYTMTIRGNKMIRAAVPQVLCTEAVEVEPEHLWCFVSKDDGSYAVYNYAYGPEYIAWCATTASHEPLVMMKVQDAVGGVDAFALDKNQSGGYSLYCLWHNTSALNDLSNKGEMGLWDNGNSHSDKGSNIVFMEYDASEFVQDEVEEFLPVEGDVMYVYTKGGIVDAYPKSLVVSDEDNGRVLTITDKMGVEHRYRKSEVDSVSIVAPDGFASIESFKFNNKFNDMLMQDAIGEIDGDTIRVKVGSIGKRLIASIKVSDEDALLYVDEELQDSKSTSRRFTEPVVYTVSKWGYNMLREKINGECAFCPYGKDYVVIVDYLCDHPTTEHGVPVVRIKTTDSDEIISSRSYYREAVIEIDGAGYFPDLAEMPVLIKGRGNSSWNQNFRDNPKNPYHIKFDTKQKPLGMKAGKSWNLISNTISGSMTTNVIGSRAAEMVGCSGANHFLPIELYINGDYRGSYTITETVGLSNNSIDLDDESRAVLLELDTYFDEQYRFRTSDFYLPVNVKDPDFGEEGSTELTLEEVEAHFGAFAKALREGKDMSEYVDMQSLARYLMLNELIVNRELFHPKSMFCYNEDIRDAESKYVFGPAWDFDWGYGYESTRNYFMSDQKMDFWNWTNFEAKDFIYKLRYCGEDLNREYYRVWDDFFYNHLDDLMEYCDDYNKVAAKSFEHDNSKWRSGGESTYNSITKRSKSWLKARSQYVYDYLTYTLGYGDKGYLDPEEEPEPSDIADVKTGGAAVAKGVYDLSGRRMGDDLSGLAPGVYIVNGRKVRL